MRARRSPALANAIAIAALASALAIGGCKQDAASDAVDAGNAADAGPDGCAALFGRPNDQTGLTAEQCRPTCTCGGSAFTPPTYDAAFVQRLIDGWKLTTPYAEVVADPYAGPAPIDDPAGTVCAVLPTGDPKATPRSYDLVTYPSEEAARAAGAAVTHFGRCGVCSPLADLAVYVAQNDLTAPVRACGFETPTDGGSAMSADVACLQKLGFDLPCAEAWAFDTAHTRSKCLSICLANLDQPYNLEDGTLNPCIQCDEEESGPVFKAVAGRTRRNSGLPNAICRPCSEVRPLVHAY
jgi:hypothetical protein